jgi:microcystin-dependent protein
MSQATDWGVPPAPPVTPTAYSVRLNESLDAVLSSHRGAAAPEYVTQGTVWVDDSGSPVLALKMRDEAANDVVIGEFESGAFLPSLARLAEIRNAIIPVGIGPIPWLLPTDPTDYGFEYCYGQAITAGSYPILNQALIDAGYPYGGSGANPLAPDMRGRVPIGKDDMGGVGAGRVTTAGGGVDGTTLGASGGAQNRTVATANMPAHTHGAGSFAADSHSHGNGTFAISETIANGTNVARNLSFSTTTRDNSGGVTIVDDLNFTENNLSLNNGDVTGTSSSASAGVSGTSGSAGSGTALQTLPPTLVCYYVMKAH